MTYIALPTSTSALPDGYSGSGVIVRIVPGAEVHALSDLFIANLHASIHDREAHVIHVMGGRNGWNSSSVLGDVAEYLSKSTTGVGSGAEQDRLNSVSAATEYFIRSTSASDDGDPVGTGARTVRVFYLDASGVMAVKDVTMNGTTGVSLSSTPGTASGISYFMWAEVKTVGSNTTSVGTITISSNSGAPAYSEIVEQITAGGNRSLSGRIKVPTGYTGYLIDWGVRAIGTTMDTRIRMDQLQDPVSNGVSAGVFHFADRMYLASGENDKNELHYRKVLSGVEVKMSALPGATPHGNRIDADFDILLIADA